MIYRLVAGWPIELATLDNVLGKAQFVECGASQEKSVGWVEPRGHAHGLMVEVIAGQWLLKLMMEVKVVPGSVVKRKVQDQLDHIHLLHSSHSVEKHNLVVRDLVKWKFGHLKHMVLRTHCKKY